MASTPEIRNTQSFGLVSGTITTTVRATQAYTLTAINFPSPEIRNTQAEALVVVKYDTKIRNTQSYVLVALKTGAENHRLRAWTFTQDDHDFYVVQLGDTQTLIYDKLSQRWSKWVSPGFNHWRGNDGRSWEGINVCCDSQTGKIWKIDPAGRLDYRTTPIVSQIYGGMSDRFRTLTPCYMAEVAISQALPPAGIDASTVGLRLRTYDTLNWVDHGVIQGQLSGNRTYARFYGLGLIKSPGIVFEITDYGYARRIDGLNVEVGGTPSG